MAATKSLLTKVLIWMGLILFFLWTFFPVFWAISLSFKSGSELFVWPPRYIPEQPTFDNYRGALEDESRGVLGAMKNSLIIMAVSTPISVLLSALAGFGLARFKFRGKEYLRYAILIIRMIPGLIIAIPMFVMVRLLGLQDNIITLIVAYTAFNLPFNIWMLAGFFEEIPRAIEESALIDGCTPWKLFTKVIFPLSAPALVASTIFCMLFSWNEFQVAVILLLRNKTLPIVVASFWTDRGIRFSQMAATGVMAMLPVLAFGTYIQKFLVQGLTAGAVKG